MKKIKLESLKLTNFRNIESMEFEFKGDRVAIAGKNRIGKTNTILALYWLLTDKLLDGSSNIDSIKPLFDTKKRVEVNAIFRIEDDATLESKHFEVVKIYYENWAKKRGTNEFELTGNNTEYIIDGIDMKVTEALEKIRNELGLNDIKFSNGNKIDSTINLISALTNPFYLTEQVDEKALRSFIIGLVGDVTDVDVYQKEPICLAAKEILSKYTGDTSNATKFLKSQIKELNDSLKMIEGFITELSKDQDIPIEEFQGANREILRITQAIEDLKSAKEIEDPRIVKLDNQIKSLYDQKNEIINKLKQEVLKMNNDVLNQIALMSNKKNDLINGKQRAQEEKIQLASNIAIKKQEIQRLEFDIECGNKNLTSLREEYKEVYASQYEKHEDTCPNCGYVLNVGEIAKAQSEFEENKKSRLESLNFHGKGLKFDLENKTLKLNECKKELEELETTKIFDSVDYDKAIENMDKDIQSAQSYTVKLDEYCNNNKDYNDILNLITEKETYRDSLKESMKNVSTFDKISELESSMAPYKEIIEKHSTYESSQKKIASYTHEIQVKTKSLNDLEQQLMGVDLFVKTRLKMIDERVSKVFGDIKIQLIKNNIKKDSWEPICKPCIKGKDTLFTNGSTSEKITTGIAFIECVKRALNLNDLPILFDEGEALDKDTINHLDTNSQIILALVNDNFSTPTAIVLSK